MWSSYVYIRVTKLLIYFSMIIISVDIYNLNVEELPSEIFTFRNPNFKYLFRSSWQRVFIGNLFMVELFFLYTKKTKKMTSCAIASKMSKYTMDIKNIYPPFLSMFIISNLLCFKIAVYSYFFDGCSWSIDKKWGFFGIV